MNAKSNITKANWDLDPIGMRTGNRTLLGMFLLLTT